MTAVQVFEGDGSDPELVRREAAVAKREKDVLQREQIVGDREMKLAKERAIVEQMQANLAERERRVREMEQAGEVFTTYDHRIHENGVKPRWDVVIGDKGKEPDYLPVTETIVIPTRLLPVTTPIQPDQLPPRASESTP